MTYGGENSGRKDTGMTKVARMAYGGGAEFTGLKFNPGLKAMVAVHRGKRGAIIPS